MNDDDLTTLLKEPFADVHMTMPLDQVARRGRAVRARRRRLRGLTGAVALAGGAAAAVALLGSGGYPVRAQLAAWTVTTFPDGGIKVTLHQMKDPAGLQATLRADGIPARVTFDPAVADAPTLPLPAGCTAPDMSDRANAQITNKILTPPAIASWGQHVRQRVKSLPIQYTMNGHVEHATVPAFGEGQQKKVQQLWKKGARNIQIFVTYRMPISLQKLQEKETQDAAGRTAVYINKAAIPAGMGLWLGVDVQSPSSFNVEVDLVVTSQQCTGS